MATQTITLENATPEQAQALINLWRAIRQVPGEIYLGDPKSTPEIRTNRKTRESAKQQLLKNLAAQWQKKYPLSNVK